MSRCTACVLDVGAEISDKPAQLIGCDFDQCLTITLLTIFHPRLRASSLEIPRRRRDPMTTLFAALLLALFGSQPPTPAPPEPRQAEQQQATESAESPAVQDEPPDEVSAFPENQLDGDGQGDEPDCDTRYHHNSTSNWWLGLADLALTAALVGVTLDHHARTRMLLYLGGMGIDHRTKLGFHGIAIEGIEDARLARMLFGSVKGFAGTAFGATGRATGVGADFGAAAVMGAGSAAGAGASLACSPAHAATIAASIAGRTALASLRIPMSPPSTESSPCWRRGPSIARTSAPLRHHKLYL